MCFMMAFSGCAFLLLNVSKTAKRFHVRLTPNCNPTIESDGNEVVALSGEKQVNKKPKPSAIKPVGKVDGIIFLSAIFWKSFLVNGLYPSISAYASIPYGNTAYHVSSVLRTATCPVGCFVAMLLPTKNQRWIGLCIAFGSGNTLQLHDLMETTNT